MGKIFRLYNQNRIKVWISILVIIFMLTIIKTLNGIYKTQNEQKNTISKNTTQNDDRYENQSKSLVSGGTVSESLKETFGKTIDNFLTYCKNHEPEKAYGLLSQDCKSILYPNEKVFEEQYYKGKFTGEKKYSFQSWTSNETYIYLVKIFNNMLATGMGSSENYIQDYISVVKENETYKLNINGFVGKAKREKETNKKGISIKVDYSELYMDYEIVHFTVKNETESSIVLDSKEETKTTYIEDARGNKYEAMLYELSETDITVEPKEEKEIQIKYSNPYREKMTADKYVFSDIRVHNQDDDIVEIIVELH